MFGPSGRLFDLREAFHLGFSARITRSYPSDRLRPYKLEVFYNRAPVGEVQWYGSYQAAFQAIPGRINRYAVRLGVWRQGEFTWSGAE